MSANIPEKVLKDEKPITHSEFKSLQDIKGISLNLNQKGDSLSFTISALFTNTKSSGVLAEKLNDYLNKETQDVGSYFNYLSDLVKIEKIGNSLSIKIALEQNTRTRIEKDSLKIKESLSMYLKEYQNIRELEDIESRPEETSAQIQNKLTALKTFVSGCETPAIAAKAQNLQGILQKRLNEIISGEKWDKIKTQISTSSLPEAWGILSKFSKSWPETQYGKEAQNRLLLLEDEIEKTLSQGNEETERLLEQEKPDDAISLSYRHPFQKYGKTPDGKKLANHSKIGSKLMKMEELLVQAEQKSRIYKETQEQKRKKASSEIEKNENIYNESFDRFMEMMKSRNYKDAENLLQEIKNSFDNLGERYSSNNDTYKEIVQRLEDIHVIEEFVEQAEEGAQKSLGQEISIISIYGIPIRVRISMVEDQKITFINDKGEKYEQTVISLSPATLLTLASTVKENAQSSLALGLLYYYENQPSKGKEALLKALKDGIQTERLESYINELSCQIYSKQARLRKSSIEKEKEKKDTLIKKIDKLGAVILEEAQSPDMDFKKILLAIDSLIRLTNEDILVFPYIERQYLQGSSENYVKTLAQRCPGCRGSNSITCKRCGGRKTLSESGSGSTRERNRVYEFKCPACAGQGRQPCSICSYLNQSNLYRRLPSILEDIKQRYDSAKKKVDNISSDITSIIQLFQSEVSKGSVQGAILAIERLKNLYSQDTSLRFFIETENIINSVFPNGIEKDLQNLPCSECQSKRYIKKSDGTWTPCPTCYNLIISERYMKLLAFFGVTCQFPKKPR